METVRFSALKNESCSAGSRGVVIPVDIAAAKALAIARPIRETERLRPADLPSFIVAEFAGALVAMILAAWLLAEPHPIAQRKPAE